MPAKLFVRNRGNPIIQASDLPYQANSVFNPGAAIINGETLLLMRVEDRRGLSHLTVARSKDGIGNWTIDTKPTLLPDPISHPEEMWGIEDPRITYIEEQKCWAICYTSYSKRGPLVSMATTTDFKIFERRGIIMPPDDKDAAIFPVKFNDRWAMLHRPMPAYQAAGAHIWISFSSDMLLWGDHHQLIPSRLGGWWDANKIGLSPPPLQTEKGWLLLYHGVKVTSSGAIYRLGLALLDLHDPLKVLKRSDEWMFSPQEKYEIFGDVNNVVFPCGWIAEGDRVRIYYGGGDRCIAVAEASISELLEWLDKHNSSDIDLLYA